METYRPADWPVHTGAALRGTVRAGSILWKNVHKQYRRGDEKT